ncbi:MAG: DNA primase [Candidatus Omnitrophota bacterium]
MTGRIPENILEDVLSRTNIVEVISGYIPLKRAGRNFKALCPFHHEKTPSFMVSPDRQIYHCFGCQESGNAFKFLMRYERMDFPEAVELLAKKAGVVLPKAAAMDNKTEGLITQLYKINELAALFYAGYLNSAEAAKAKTYLLKRGINEDAIKLFKLGLAPDKWDGLINHLRSKGIGLSLIEKAGLILPRDGGGYYDRFRNRIIFPVFDIKSRILGFGARVMDEALPKYINSPETAIYIKGKNLYGLNLSKEGIRDSDSVIIVEGYLDFITPFVCGVKNIIASSGTALTLDQVRLLKRYTHNVVMVYDADQAGELATLRALDIFIEEDMQVKVAALPKAEDPDSFVRKYGIDKFKDAVHKAKGLFEYKLEALRSRFSPKEIEGKRMIASKMLETISKFKSPILISEYVKKLAVEIDVKEDALLEEMGKVKEPGTKFERGHYFPQKGLAAVNPTEKLLVKLMLDDNDLMNRLKETLGPDDFQDPRIANIVSVMYEHFKQGKTIGAHLLVNYLPEEDISRIFCESVFLPDSLSEDNKEKVISDCVNRIKSERLKVHKKSLHEQIKTAQQAGDKEELNRLVAEFHRLIKKR